MAKIEYIEDGGLVIIREGISPDLASMFCVEQTQWISALILAKMMGKDTDPTVAHDTSLWLVRSQRKMRATRKILDSILTDKDSSDSFTTNFQPTLSAQVWHEDDTHEPAIIIHGSDGGCFDYSPEATCQEEAEMDYRSIDVNAGDLVIQLKTNQFHRGRNPSDHPRISAVVWTAAHLYS